MGCIRRHGAAITTIIGKLVYTILRYISTPGTDSVHSDCSQFINNRRWHRNRMVLQHGLRSHGADCGQEAKSTGTWNHRGGGITYRLHYDCGSFFGQLFRPLPLEGTSLLILFLIPPPGPFPAAFQAQRWGRKPALLSGCISFIIAFTVNVCAREVWHLYLARFFQVSEVIFPLKIPTLFNHSTSCRESASPT